MIETFVIIEFEKWSNIDLALAKTILEPPYFYFYDFKLIITKGYSRNRLLQFINKYDLASGKIVLLTAATCVDGPSKTVNLVIDDVNYSFQLKSLAITQTNLKKGLVEGYFSYYAKQAKRQKEERQKVIYEQDTKIEPSGEFESMFQKRYIVPGSFKSSYIIGPELTSIKNRASKLYKDTVIPQFEEIIIPKYTTETIFAKSNHIRLPEHSYVLTRIAKTAIPLKELYGHLFKEWRLVPSELKIAGVSTYGVCEPFWSYLENTQLKKCFTYFDNSGYSLRNEGNATKSLERLDAFSRIETIFAYATNTQVESHISRYVERMKQFLHGLGLKYRVLEVESWTPQETKVQHVKTYDFEAYLSYKDQWLEIGNISNNGTVFSRAFNVRFSPTNTYAYTGCSGLGLERLLYILIEQKGYKHVIA